ncbi:OmpA family protein [Chryseobacterium sp. WG14]|uniref:OmpA family protein n=1 Tax=Chryseobacterium sp. WG14 TaxID=2926909 RepID=UPI00211EDEBB|nr:OmpA family protein [Chryseobacterium sp. WG14]MCQ9642026.1 OmpA family protein [Chryseobacterium sp. WG14]
MAKGIKKINIATAEDNTKVVATQGDFIGVEPGKPIWFQVSEWFPGTPEADKKKEVIWIRQDSARQKVINQLRRPAGYVYSYTFTKKECGILSYYIEASLGGKPDKVNKVGKYIFGHCPPRIVDSRWSTTEGGKDVRQTFYFSYGHIIHLYLGTEGLNGRKDLIVEIYRRIRTGRGAKDDPMMRRWADVEVNDGEINVKVQNTSQWKGVIKDIKDVEELYVKVKDPKTGKYIVDDNNDDIHARFLRMKNELVAAAPQPPQNVVPTKIYAPDKNLARYEPCKFETIQISDIVFEKDKEVKKPITLFNKGVGVKNIAERETIHATIFYEFNSAVIEGDGEKKLNNILRFLLEHQHSTITVDGYACVIGKMQYNQSLSQKRSDIVKKFFTDGGLDSKRIKSLGKGEVHATDDKNGKDNVKYKDEKEYKNNRRVDIYFDYYPHDANTIIYHTIAPSSSTKRNITIDVSAFDTKACFRNNDLHTKEIRLLDVGQAIDAGDKEKKFAPPTFDYPVYSDLSRANALPLQYIWPEATTPNKIQMYAHSCRFYSNKKRTTVLIKAYPDIKWDFHFFLNLSNDLSVKWQNLSAARHKEMQEKAGKIGAEKRWKQTEVDFGVTMEANWDRTAADKYNGHADATLKFEDKIKWMYKVFSSLKEFSKGVTDQTKGKIRKKSFTSKMPLTIEMKPPNFCLGAEWMLERGKKNKKSLSTIGTDLEFYFKASPIVGIEITIDLLDMLIQAGVGVVSGGTANVAAKVILDEVRAWLADEDHPISLNMYIDLKVFGNISGESKIHFNTNSDESSGNGKLETQIGIELDAGIEVKAKFVIIVAEAYAEGKIKATGKATATFGHNLIYDQKSSTQKTLYYKPDLKFDGLVATVVVKASVGLYIKKGILKGDRKMDLADFDKTYEILPEFDIIEKLEKYTGFSPTIPFIQQG